MTEVRKCLVALFKNTHGWDTVLHTEVGNTDYTLSGYCRLSEWVEIEWIPLPFEEVRNGQINALEQEKEEIVNEYGRKLANIEERLSKLKALTGPGDIPPPSVFDDDIPF